jgi:hypothetical protein
VPFVTAKQRKAKQSKAIKEKEQMWGFLSKPKQSEAK